MIKEESQLTTFHYKRLNKILNKKSSILSLQNHFKIELDKMKSDLVLIGSNVNQIRYLYGWPMVIFIFKHLFKNEFLNKSNITFKRTGKIGISIDEFNFLKKPKLSKDMKKDKPIFIKNLIK